MHISKQKRVKKFPDRLKNSLNVIEVDRFDIDKAMLPEDSWGSELKVSDYEWEDCGYSI